MRYRVLACDYDRTIAQGGVVSRPVRRLLRQVRDSGRALVLVTGRTSAELQSAFDDPSLFDILVVENGAVLQDQEGRQQLLGPPLSPSLVASLEQLEVEPLVVGSVMCSTASANIREVRAALAEQGMRMDLVLNRDSVMVLPHGIDKGTGLRAALDLLHRDAEATVAAGDGENDDSLLLTAGVGVAVENAVPQLKDIADIVLKEPGAQGWQQLCDAILQDDLEPLLRADTEVSAG